MVLLNSLLGAGASRTVMVVSITLQWGVGLVMAWVAGPLLGLGLLGMWFAQVAYRAILAIVFALTWRGEGWTRIRV